MRRILSTLICIFTAFFIVVSFAAPEKYVFDPTHTYVVWRVNHFGFSHPSGKWLADGTLMADEEKPEDSKLNVKIKLADIVTGIPKFDQHLKSKDFFDVAKFPTATFVSTEIKKTGTDTAEIHGMLTLHGVTKPIVLNVKLNKVDVSPMTQNKTAGFSATALLKRSDFGLDKYAPGVSDEVEVNIEAEAQKATA